MSIKSRDFCKPKTTDESMDEKGQELYHHHHQLHPGTVVQFSLNSQRQTRREGWCTVLTWRARAVPGSEPVWVMACGEHRSLQKHQRSLSSFFFLKNKSQQQRGQIIFSRFNAREENIIFLSVMQQLKRCFSCLSCNSICQCYSKYQCLTEMFWQWVLWQDVCLAGTVLLP